MLGAFIINKTTQASNHVPGVGMWDGHVVTKSDGCISSEYSGFLPHEDHRNINIGAKEHD